jgi:hydroxyethylthiazole kinase-like uncharacterized protein yjeF
VKLEDLPLVRDVPSVSASQMAEADRFTIEELGIGVDVLMETASRQVAAAARALLGGAVRGGHVIGLVGSGNNGGDALGALRHLTNWGATVRAALASPRERLRETAALQATRLERATNDPATVYDAAANGARDLDADLVIDGLLGYSARGPARGAVATLVAAANASGVPILAVDIPSGLDPDTGIAPGAVVNATATVTLALPKTGLTMPTARSAVGRLLLADIGIPHLAFARAGLDTRRLFEKGDLLRLTD